MIDVGSVMSGTSDGVGSKIRVICDKIVLESHEHHILKIIFTLIKWPFS